MSLATDENGYRVWLCTYKIGEGFGWLANACHCVPGQDRFDDKVATPQRSYTDGHSVVMGDTLSFTDLRQRKQGKHRTCFSWGGSGDTSPCEDEIYLLEDSDRTEGKKAA